MRILHTTFEFLSAFYKIDKFVTGPFETCLWIRLCYFLNKQGIQVCVVSNFYPGWEKISIIWKIWNFHPVLKFHLGLAKPSWNFNSVYWIGFFTCNFFFCQGFLSQTLTVDRTAAEGRGASFISLYHFHPITNIEIFFATLHVRWPSRIFNRKPCAYQTATRLDLQPYRITIWLID